MTGGIAMQGMLRCPSLSTMSDTGHEKIDHSLGAGKAIRTTDYFASR